MSQRALQPVVIAALLALSFVASVRAQVTETAVTLAWTAPGDDSLTGRATRYDLRWSLAPIANLTDFSRATAVANVPAPQTAGSSESFTVTGLSPATAYWFAIRTFDEAGNGSGLSNVVTATTLVSTDVIRPAPVPLALVTTGSTSVTVSWNDVGDDSLTGVATATEIRWSTAQITEANWASATLVSNVPAPGAPGTAHQMTIGGLDRSRDLWFGARARDEVNQYSGLATPLQVPHALDTSPPAAPAGLAGSPEPGGGVRVNWAANTEPDLAGYNVYRAFVSGGPYSRINSSLVATNSYLDASAPDTTTLWYEVTAQDGTGNESARSAPTRVILRTQAVGANAWTIATPFPNPSRSGAPVTFPLEVPAAGPFEATVEIQDAAGQYVRLMRITNAAPGPIALVWDGKNDLGRDTVPGVYSAWLRAGDTRQLARFVRVP